MKSLIEEYGRIVILLIVILVLAGYVFSFERDKDGNATGFFAQLQDIKPEATVEVENNSDLLKAYSSRSNPILEVKTQKLEADKGYDLLSFVTKAHDVDNTDLVVRVTKITDPDGKAMNLPVLDGEGKLMMSFPKVEKDPTKGDYNVGYRVTYEVVDNFFPGYPLKTTKTYQFVVN